MPREILGTQQKALQINLDASKYGTFAEIGAGQEVARWFFRVGGAAGTVAKSISAYDMAFSDAIYGANERYVSQARLQNMLDHEYGLLIERLSEKRGGTTKFFAFADTVAAQSYKGAKECHGWMGIRFQPAPHAEPSTIIMHVRMWDKENLLQQEALGMVGVNLVYGALYLSGNPEEFIASLLDNLNIRRIEVDMIKFIGPLFKEVDNRLMSMELVKLGLTDAAMFAADGEVLQPSEVFYKKPVLVERGSFRPVTHVNIDMLECARAEFVKSPEVHAEPIVLMEITMKNLLAEGEVDPLDFLARADILAASGKTVLISNYAEYFRLAAYIRRYTKEMIGVTMGVPSMRELFDERYYENLDGGILESFGRLFKSGVRLYVYPLKEKETGKLTTIHNLRVPSHLENLYHHLLGNGFVEAIDTFNPAYLSIFSRDCLKKIASGDETWEKMVPPEVAKIIRERKFFGYAG
jgi:hypothetical protein